ncbi:MAG: FAD-dependent oxidoreductase [Candidatus Eremiobacteraeota bacterium]|nr:FAD-dependent oxidoreductase [Candidatus Eremiobacteraeota bacterium]
MEFDAIVIGAGAAGLMAARELAARSLRVALVEARDRVGGRVWTQPTSLAAAPAELGAEFIHGPAVETKTLLRGAGMTTIELGDESWTQTPRGLEPSETDFIAAASLFEEAQRLADDESVDDFLKRFATDETKRPLAAAARAFVEGFDAADPAIASVRGIADEWQSGADATSARPCGGYQPLVESLFNACTAAGARIFLSTIVRHIAWGPNGVAIDVQSAAQTVRTLRARNAIVTLPVGVLRSTDAAGVTFEPRLPQSKRDALERIEMGHVVKVALEFRSAFWERIHGGRYGEAAFFRSETSAFPAYWTQFPLRTELVLAWAGGPKATALMHEGRDALIKRALNGFGELFGEPELARSEFKTAYTHDWNGDPFSRGAYSYLTVGAADARRVLGVPIEETLFFAGEATSTDGQGGTVNGALQTGQRAAAELLDA